MLSTIATVFGLAAAATATGISVTPHDVYSSSIGVLGCKINTNRVAYWPMFPSCDGMCVKVTANGRSVNLLQIDSSGGAYDISYDAYVYLATGNSAVDDPIEGGGMDVDYESVDMSECADLINTPDGKLPLMAANSIGFYVGCGADSWVGQNSGLWNIANCDCTLGFNEQCTLELAVSNQPSCAHILGAQNPLSGLPVDNIVYGTGAVTTATQ